MGLYFSFFCCVQSRLFSFIVNGIEENKEETESHDFSSQNTKLAILPSFTSTYECYFVDVPKKIKNRIRFVSLTHAYHTHTTDRFTLLFSNIPERI